MSPKARHSINWTVVLTALISAGIPAIATVSVALINASQTRANETKALRSHYSEVAPAGDSSAIAAADTATLAIEPSPIGRIFGGKVRYVKAADLARKLGVTPNLKLTPRIPASVSR